MRWTLLLLLLFFGLLTAPQAGARQTERTYTGLDILFLVDQSNSMSGIPPARSATDPDGLRFQAVQYALSTLDDYRTIVPADTTFRMAVLYFGDRAETVVDWTTIGASLNWRADREALQSLLSKDASRSSGFGNTNFLDGFELAEALFNRLPAPVDGEHLRVMVVLTDGAPCAPTRLEWRDKSCTNEADKDNHMTMVQQVVNRGILSTTQIHVIAIDQTNEFYPVYRTRWERIARGDGQAVQITRSEEIAPRFLSILAKLTRQLRVQSDDSGSIIGQQVVFLDGSNQTEIRVNPYYQSIRLTLFRAGANTEITLQRPDGQIASPGQLDVRITTTLSAIEVWTILNPAPGTWRLTTTDVSLLDVFVDLLRPEPRLSFAPDGTIPPFTRVYFTFSLLGADRQPLPVYTDPRFRLDAQITLGLPDGSRTNVPMTPIASGEYRASYLAQQAGLYTVAVSASTTNLDGQPAVIANLSGAGQFRVATNSFVVDGLPTGSYLAGDPITLRARFVTADGQNLDISNLAIRAKLSRLNGTTVSEFPLTLQPDSTYTATYRTEIDPGQFVMTVQALIDGAVVAEQSSEMFSIITTQLILMQFIPPTTRFEHTQTVGYPPTNNPLTITLLMTDSTSLAPYELAGLIGSRSPAQLTLTRRTDAPQTTDTRSLPFQAVLGEVGRYQVVIDALEPAEYSLEVRADETALNNTTLRFHPSSLLLRAELVVSGDPAVLLWNTVFSLLLLALAAAITLWVLRERALRVHPITGSIQFVVQDIDDIDMIYASQTISVGNYRRNRMTLSGKKIPSAFHAKKVILSAGTPQHTQSRSVNIELHLEGSNRPFRARLTPGSAIQVKSDEKHICLVIKDPNSMDYY
jgi:hypothetical protein